MEINKGLLDRTEL